MGFSALAGFAAGVVGLDAGAAGFGVAGLVGAAFVVEVFCCVDVVEVVLVKDGDGVEVEVVRVNRVVALFLASLRLVTKAESKCATAVAIKAAISASSGGASKNAQHIPKIAAA